MKQIDVIIIGAGPIGIACGIEAKKRGLSFLILEKGCLVNSLYHYPVNMQFFSSSNLLELDNIPFVSIETKPRRNEALEYYRRVAEANQLNINLFEEVVFCKKTTEHVFTVKTTKNQYEAQYVIVATGFYDKPNLLNIPGESLSKVAHYYKDPHYYGGTNVAVIGASNSSVDAALECYRKGAKVTMVVRDSQISSHVKYWVRPDLENRIAEGSIAVLFNSNITSIAETSIEVSTPEGTLTLPNDFVLALTGYQPNFEFLEKLGISFAQNADKTPTYNTETMETNVSNLFLAGVVCGGLNTHTWFIENSRIHAVSIFNHINSKYRYRRS